MTERTIAVVGLGPAGLRTAMLLKSMGYDVSLFEARDRIGGKLWTINTDQGDLFEAGGEWIDSDHHRTLSLMTELQIEPLPADSWPKRVVYAGRSTNEATIWSDSLEDDLRIDAVARELIEELDKSDLQHPRFLEWDWVPMDRFVSQNTKSERGNWWVNAKLRSDEGDDLERIGLLGWLQGYKLYLDRDNDAMSAFRFPQGSTRFCQKMLEKVDCQPNLSHTLKKVVQNQKSVTLQFEESSFEAAHVILAIPPKCLERIVFEPAMPAVSRCAIEACEMSNAIKIVWEFDSPWWMEKNWGGAMLCDKQIQQTWPSSLVPSAIEKGRQNQSRLLTAYTCGDEAAALIKTGDPVQFGLHQLAQIEPDAIKHFKKGWSFDWNADNFALGSFSHIAPGYVLEHQENIATKVNRIHFAGEHTAKWVGFIEGALESAERVVKEVVDA